MNALLQAKDLGQSIWLDNLSRTLLQEGGLKRMIEQDGISGVTSNPSIFHKAVSTSPYYQDDLARMKAAETDLETRYEALVIPDIQAACDLLEPVFKQSNGDNGYVSLEVSPRLAHNVETTVAEARRLWAKVGRENLLIKVPGTQEGARAFEELIVAGINVNVTLLFSLHHCVRVFEAYIRGLHRRMEAGGDARRIKAVASLFLSRVDTLLDKQLDGVGTDAATRLKGKSAVSMAKLAYQRYREIFHGPMFAELASQGCRPQYLLWASTGTKNPAYSDVLYVEPLIGPETINTLPDATIEAFRDHGIVSATVADHVGEAQQHYIELEQLGLDMHKAGEQLQEDGVRLFDEAYGKLLGLVA
jgi:transaldolase